MNTMTQPAHQADILSRAFDKQPEGLTTDAARYFLSLALAADDETRVNALAEKARQGILTPAEEHDLEEYRRCLRFMDMIKLRSRLVLQRAS